MKQEMLINVAQPEECRIAIVEDGQLEELYIERTSQDNYVGNIYKGKVVNLEPSIQAAFVDFGVGRNGFLHISDVEPQYYRQGGFDPEKPLGGGRDYADVDVGDDELEPKWQWSTSAVNRPPSRPRSRSGPIRAIAGSAPARARASSRRSRTSSAAATRCWCRSSRKASAPRARRFRPTSAFPAATWCLMPALGRVGVSRKIEDDDAAPQAPRHHAGAESAQGTGLHRPHRRHRSHQARAVARSGLSVAAVEGHRPPDQEDPAPDGIYEESDMIIRTIRDIFTGDIDAI